MRRGRFAGELRDVAGLADVDAMHADLACLVASSADLGGERLQPGLVAIGERKVAAAPGEFEGECAANAARSPRDGGGAANRSHGSPLNLRFWNYDLHFFRMEPNRIRVGSLT